MKDAVVFGASGTGFDHLDFLRAALARLDTGTADMLVRFNVQILPVRPAK